MNLSLIVSTTELNVTWIREYFDCSLHIYTGWKTLLILVLISHCLLLTFLFRVRFDV